MYFKLFFISENSLKNYDFHKWFHLGHVTGTWQAIRKMSIRNKWNPVGLWKIFIWIFTCENADIPYNCLYGASLVFHLCKRTFPTGFTRWFTSETFFLELKGIHTQKTFCFTEHDKTVLEQLDQNRIEKNGFALSASELI